MNAKELRIGNLVKIDGNVVDVIGVNSGVIEITNGAEPYSINDIEPIPLSEERLIKFGYDSTNEKYLTGTIWRKGDNVKLSILIDKRGIVGILIYGYFKYLESGISVHKFQNLYFALNGDEVL